MREMIKMVVVLTVLSSFSGGLLAAIKNSTQDKIENQQLTFVKGPAINVILKGASNDPINDRFKLKTGDREESFFVGIFNGEPNIVAFENYGKGFGGDIGVMVGVNLEDSKIVAIGVTTHSETPGVGSRAKTDQRFGDQFKGLVLADAFKLKTNGGQIDAISGATVSSKGVCGALTEASKKYNQLKPEIYKKVKQFK